MINKDISISMRSTMAEPVNKPLVRSMNWLLNLRSEGKAVFTHLSMMNRIHKAGIRENNPRKNIECVPSSHLPSMTIQR